jgi:hypothetical protein
MIYLLVLDYYLAAITVRLECPSRELHKDG